MRRVIAPFFHYFVVCIYARRRILWNYMCMFCVVAIWVYFDPIMIQVFDPCWDLCCFMGNMRLFWSNNVGFLILRCPMAAQKRLITSCIMVYRILGEARPGLSMHHSEPVCGSRTCILEQIAYHSDYSLQKGSTKGWRWNKKFVIEINLKLFKIGLPHLFWALWSSSL